MVDDDGDARRAMCRTLEFHGYSTLQAEGGSDAIDILRSTPEEVDLVVVDERSEDIDQIRGAVERASDLPFTPEELVRTVERLVDEA